MLLLAAGSSSTMQQSSFVLQVMQSSASTSHVSQASPFLCQANCPHTNVTKQRAASLRAQNGLLVNRKRLEVQIGSAGWSLQKPRTAVVCGLGDFIGGDLLGFDLDDWSKDVEKHGAIAVYAPAEGGYEGRYATRLKGEGYHFLNISARGLGDPEAYLTKVHGVRPAHLGKQAIARYYLPPEVDYRLSVLPKNSKGLILWVLEAKVLSKTELQYLAMLPDLRPKVKVIAECGTWRSFRWKPLKEKAGLPTTFESQTADAKS